MDEVVDFSVDQRYILRLGLHGFGPQVREEDEAVVFSRLEHGLPLSAVDDDVAEARGELAESVLDNKFVNDGVGLEDVGDGSVGRPVEGRPRRGPGRLQGVVRGDAVFDWRARLLEGVAVSLVGHLALDERDAE